MKHVARAVVALFMMLLLGSTYATTEFAYTTVSSHCKKNSKQKQCKKGKVVQPVTKKKGTAKKLPPIVAPVIDSPRGLLATKSLLSGKQEAMREAFAECIRNVTDASPTAAVVEFVFQEQAVRERSGLRAFWLALRGSTAHHAHEVCLARTFRLRGFRDLAAIEREAGKLLVAIPSPYVEVVAKEIPADRRFTRPWVRDYITVLARDMHQYFAQEGNVSPSLLRITSMIRSYEDQAKEVRRGHSPADCRYPFLCSTHTSGSSLDLGLKDVSRQGRAWLEARLIADQKARKIFFIIERSHYHVFVLPPEYMGEE